MNDVEWNDRDQIEVSERNLPGLTEKTMKPLNRKAGVPAEVWSKHLRYYRYTSMLRVCFIVVSDQQTVTIMWFVKWMCQL